MVKRPGFGIDLDDVRADVQQQLDRGVSNLLSVVKHGVPISDTAVIEEKRPKTSAEAMPASRTPRSPTPRKPLRQRDKLREANLVNVTTRLRSDTKELLAEAALRQKLAKAVPDTEQAIIEEALQQWFKRQGYRIKEDGALDDESSDAAAEQ